VKTATERTTALTARELRTRLERRARRSGISVSEELALRLVAYFELLARWNHKINLTSLPLVEPTDETFDRLLIEPLIASRYLPSADCSVIDVGSGGGSPAIPLKLAMPGISIRMVESKTRKAAFLREAVRRLALQNVIVEATRFEELLAQPGLHEHHDVAMLRAVRLETRTLKTVHAFLRFGGYAFLFRGPGADVLPAATLPSFSTGATYPLVESLGSQVVILRKSRFERIAQFGAVGQ
jgi:16S rRNA (guanine527-N7)-methyltransferase